MDIVFNYLYPLLIYIIIRSEKYKQKRLWSCNIYTFCGLFNRIVSAILTEIEKSIAKSSLLEDFRMIKVPDLLAKCIELIELLVRCPFPAKSLYYS